MYYLFLRALYHMRALLAYKAYRVFTVFTPCHWIQEITRRIQQYDTSMALCGISTSLFISNTDIYYSNIVLFYSLVGFNCWFNVKYLFIYLLLLIVIIYCIEQMMGSFLPLQCNTFVPNPNPFSALYCNLKDNTFQSFKLFCTSNIDLQMLK